MEGINKKFPTVFFDVGGVLLIDFIDWKIKDLAAKYATDENLLFDAKNKFRPMADRGEISDPEFWEWLLKTADISADKEDIDLGPYMKTVDGGIDIARELKTNGYTIAILSNDSVEMSNHRRRKYGFDDLFDHIVISCYHGVNKPERRIYEIALNEMDIKPEQAIFIDDRQENIDAANNLGITGILFENASQVRNRLTGLGIVLT
ncbi:MAG: HAD family phosphatase [Prolixibacteraceae bacterium]|jgi:epoxide hydrolase-like predicted phosphatase|nr:HAD family phosphatase [Prolixibacteraceae bacterium]